MLLESFDKVFIIVANDVEFFAINVDSLEETLMNISVIDIVFFVVVHYLSEFNVDAILAADCVDSAHDDLIDVHVHYDVCCLANYMFHEVINRLENLLLKFQTLSDLVDLKGCLVEKAFEASFEEF